MVIMIQVPLFYSDRVLGDGENVLRSPHPQAVRKGDSTIQRQAAAAAGCRRSSALKPTLPFVTGMESAGVHCSKRVYGVCEKTLFGRRNL